MALSDWIKNQAAASADTGLANLSSQQKIPATSSGRRRLALTILAFEHLIPRTLTVLILTDSAVRW